VQSVVVDPTGSRLWILDTGSLAFGRVKPSGPKLVAVDLNTNRVTKKIIFPADVALPMTYLNDIRFDLHRGAEGIAFITDSSSAGPNGIIVVDLASGKSWRRLNNHPQPNLIRLLSLSLKEKSCKSGSRDNRLQGLRWGLTELRSAPIARLSTTVR